MRIIESRPEMGAPYPQERGGKQRGPRDIVHPIWPPRPPLTLSPAVERAARDLDKAIRNYLRPPEAL